MNQTQRGPLTRSQIIEQLEADGFDVDPRDVESVTTAIQLAARSGALLWTADRIVSTLHNHQLDIKRGSYR